MAQEIMVAGAIYEDVPSVRLPDSDGVFHPFTDTSDTTAVAADVAEGKLFHLADGALATGTASGGGGGGESADPKDVNFIDYDGTVLYSYTKDEFLALTAMPANPTHAGLVSQGWNWTLADAQEYVADYGIQTIGQMYVTESGDTEIDIVLYEGRLSPYLGLAPNGTVTIDWGDGSTPDTVTGTSLSTIVDTRHDYAAAGAYTVSIHVNSGELALKGVLNGKSILHGGSGVERIDRYYAACIMGARLAGGLSISTQAFNYCVCMLTCTLPEDTRTTDANGIFYMCPSLLSMTIPPSATALFANEFSNCTALRYISLPPTIATADVYVFSSCSGLRCIAFPDVESIASNMFSSNSKLRYIAIPNGVTLLDASSLYACSLMTKVVIPSTVSQINRYALYGCNNITVLRFLPTNPPTIGQSNVFTGLPTDCIIYVPTGSLEAYTSAANYPDPTKYTYVEE